MTQLTLEEIKATELNILLEFQKFCKANNLTFYLSGGTLLGAIRHHGFIPWDDDIDVCMPRPDYNQMQKLLNTNGQLPPYLDFICYENGKLSYPITKIVDTHTRCDNEFSTAGDSQGLWIDIFPIDGLPSSIKDTAKLYKKTGHLREILALSVAKKGEGKTAARKLLKYIAIPVAKMIGSKRCADRIIQIATSRPYNNSDYVGCVVWGLNEMGERMKRTEFEISTDVSFEGHIFQTMSCWDSYLTNSYGDYMTLPPESQRKTHDMIVWRIED